MYLKLIFYILLYMAKGRKPYKKSDKTVTEKEVKKIVDAKMAQVIETKVVDNISESFIINHNSPQTIETDCYFLTQGVGDATGNTANRIGDSIYAKKVWLKAYFDHYADRPNIGIRITVVRIKAGASPVSPTLLLGHPQSNNYFINPVQTELAGLYSNDPIAYDKRFMSNHGIVLTSGTNKAVHTFKELNIPINRKFKYDGGGTNVSGPFTLQVVVTAYDSYGSLTTDNLLRLLWARRSYFIDS